MNPRARMLPLLLLATAGCTTLVRERVVDGGASPVRDVSAGDGNGEPTWPMVASETPRGSGGGGWFERQRFIFSRAWQEMRRDMDYENIDSFQQLSPEANREVRMMRDDLAGAGAEVSTSPRRSRAP